MCNIYNIIFYVSTFKNSGNSSSDKVVKFKNVATKFYGYYFE